MKLHLPKMLIIKKWKTCLIFICLLRLACPHVVFEEFGTVAGSVSYMHITVHINLTHVNNSVMEYTRQGKHLKTILCNTCTLSIYNSTNPANRVHLANQRDIAEGAGRDCRNESEPTADTANGHYAPAIPGSVTKRGPGRMGNGY